MDSDEIDMLLEEYQVYPEADIKLMCDNQTKIVSYMNKVSENIKYIKVLLCDTVIEGAIHDMIIQTVSLQKRATVFSRKAQNEHIIKRNRDEIKDIYFLLCKVRKIKLDKSKLYDKLDIVEKKIDNLLLVIYGGNTKTM
jgi:hypothetical protein